MSEAVVSLREHRDAAIDVVARQPNESPKPRRTRAPRKAKPSLIIPTEAEIAGKGIAAQAPLLARSAEEERRKILARVGDLSRLKVFGNRVLVAKFISDTVGASGRLFAAGATQQEDRYQGKIGLVIATGHAAFKSDASYDFGTDTVKVGDWVVYQYGDGTDQDLRPDHNLLDKVPCKTLRDTEIIGVVPRPTFFY